jgi:septum formation inhibitor-activating ATPase MinD
MRRELMSKFILVTSCEEQQGKTVISLELAKKLSNEGSVVYVDISGSTKNASVYLDYDMNIIYDYVDLVEDTCSLDEGKISAELEGAVFDMIPTPRLETKKAKENKIFGKLFMILNDKYDYIIIDGGSIRDEKDIMDYSVLDRILLITESRIEDFGKINTCINIIGKENAGNILYLINKYMKKEGKRGTMFKPKELEEMINLKMVGHIEFNDTYQKICSGYIENKNLLTEIESAADKIIEKLN